MLSADSVKQSCRQANAGNSLIDYWMGHSNAGMGSRYAKQLVGNRKFREEWVEKVGLGFEIPKAVISEPKLIALRALQNPQRSPKTGQ